MTSRIVVFGGNGFVGTRIVAYALSQGINVISVSRSGAPQKLPTVPLPKDNAKVTWLKGDLAKLSGK
jgi:uncharacterized protein YbjT (DUF2867 family)